MTVRMRDFDARIRQAYWIGYSDAMCKRDRERDRLREALESIIEIADRPAVITIARSALQEDVDNETT